MGPTTQAGRRARGPSRMRSQPEQGGDSDEDTPAACERCAGVREDPNTTVPRPPEQRSDLCDLALSRAVFSVPVVLPLSSLRLSGAGCSTALGIGGDTTPPTSGEGDVGGSDSTVSRSATATQAALLSSAVLAAGVKPPSTSSGLGMRASRHAAGPSMSLTPPTGLVPRGFYRVSSATDASDGSPSEGRRTLPYRAPHTTTLLAGGGSTPPSGTTSLALIANAGGGGTSSTPANTTPTPPAQRYLLHASGGSPKATHGGPHGSPSSYAMPSPSGIGGLAGSDPPSVSSPSGSIISVGGVGVMGFQHRGSISVASTSSLVLAPAATTTTSGVAANGSSPSMPDRLAVPHHTPITQASPAARKRASGPLSGLGLGAAPSGPPGSNLHLYPDLETFGLGSGMMGGELSPLASSASPPHLAGVSPASPRLSPQSVAVGGDRDRPMIGSPVLTRSSTGLPNPKRYSFSSPVAAGLIGPGMGSPQQQFAAALTGLGLKNSGSFSTSVSPTTHAQTTPSGGPLHRSFAASRFRIGGSPTLQPMQGRITSTPFSLSGSSTALGSGSGGNLPASVGAHLGFSPQQRTTSFYSSGGASSPKERLVLPGVGGAGSSGGGEGETVAPLELPPATSTPVHRMRSMSNATMAKRFSLQSTSTLIANAVANMHAHSTNATGASSPTQTQSSFSPHREPLSPVNNVNGVGVGVGVLVERERDRDRELRDRRSDRLGLTVSPSSKTYHSLQARLSPTHLDTNASNTNAAITVTAPSPLALPLSIALPTAPLLFPALPSPAPTPSPAATTATNSAHSSGVFSHTHGVHIAGHSTAGSTTPSSGDRDRGSLEHALTLGSRSLTLNPDAANGRLSNGSLPMLRRVLSEPEVDGNVQSQRRSFIEKERERIREARNATLHQAVKQ